MCCRIGWPKEHNIEILRKMRKLAVHTAGIPEKVNTMASILILLAADLHDVDISVDTRDEHLFHHSKLRQEVGNITEIKVVRRRVQIWVVRSHYSWGISIAASFANAGLNIHLGPPLPASRTEVLSIIFQSLPELTEDSQVLVVHTAVIQIPTKRWISLGQVSSRGRRSGRVAHAGGWDRVSL